MMMKNKKTPERQLGCVG